MWECYNCGFQNVDAAPVCAKCRARKPAPGEKRKGRSFHAMQEAAKERYADEVMAQAFPPIPSAKELRDKWQDAVAKPEELIEELAILERREYAIREAIRLVLQAAKNPQARGVEDILANAHLTLLNWEE